MKAKKLLAALICSSVLIGGTVEAAGNGDVNGDGQVTQADADLLLAYLRGQNVSINRSNADVNGDGDIGISDVQGILKKIREQASQTLRVAYPANGWYSLQPMCAPNKELTVENASTNKGANVFIWSINSNWHTQPSHQKWYIERVGNSEWYTIKAENSGLALNVDAGIGRDGTNITLWAKTDDNQIFRFYDAGNGYYIIQGHTNGSGMYVLDVAAARNQDGTNVHVWHYNQGAPEQKWKLEKRNPSSQSETWQYPIENKIVSNGFGDYVSFMAKQGRPYHCGLDLVNNSSRNGGNPPIYAATSGIVKYKGYSNGNGNHIVIQVNVNGQTIYTSYSHLNSYDGCPSVGQTVSKGQKIGTMGATGNVTGKHLHFAVYNKYSSDPYGYTTTSNRYSVTYNGITFYNPEYILNNGRLP